MAETVVNTEQIFKGNVLEVKRMDVVEQKEGVEKLRNREDSEEKESRIVEVSGIPVGCTENSVHIHFQRSKNGGGDIQQVKMLQEGKAMIIFEDPQGRSRRNSYVYRSTHGVVSSSSVS